MGRNAIFLVIGFTLIFVMTGRNLSSMGTTAFLTAINYYENTQGHNIAEVGANIACNQIFLNPSWRAGYSNVSFGGGTFSVVATNVSGTNYVQMVSTATYQGSTYQEIILLQPSGFAKFGFWGGTGASAAAWETGDTVTGPMHVDATLETYGRPVFTGKVTTKTGWNNLLPPQMPYFNGGYETGISLPLPTTAFPTLDSTAKAHGYKEAGSDMYLQFNADGSVTYKITSTGTPTTVPLTTLAPNGVLEVDKGNIYIQGTLSGQVTLVANRSSGSTGGQVYVQNNMVYNNDPRVNPSSTDMLGIVSYGDVTIMDNAATTFNLMGSVYSQTGGLAVTDYTSRNAGVLNVIGGMIVQNLYATSNGGTGSARRGYNLSLQYDSRFLVSSPPSFPTTGTYEILSWWE